MSPVAERGGAETVLLDLLRFQDRSRFRPAAAFLKEGPLVDEALGIVDDVSVFRTARLRSLSSLSAVRALRNVIHDRRIDVVFGNMAMGHVYGGVAALGTPARAVWFEHGIVERPALVDRVAAHVPAALTFAASTIASGARARVNGGTPVRVVPAGIDVDAYDPACHQRGTLRRELGLGADVPLVACIGRLQRGKGQQLFLEAAELVRRQMPAAHFVVAGGTLFGLEAEFAEELRRTADARLPGAVHFLGHRDDVGAVLADVDVLVHCPTAPEAFGLVVVEAMAMAVPVVSVSAWGSKEILTPETGVLVPSMLPDAIADATLGLLRDPARRSAMGRAARCRARACFSAARMVLEIERELGAVVAR